MEFNFKYYLGKALFGFTLGSTIMGILIIYDLIRTMNHEKEHLELDKEKIEKVKKFKLLSSKTKIIDNKIVILGTIKNTSTESMFIPYIVVDFYKNGNFIELCREYENGEVEASQTYNFKVNCDDGILDFDSYKVLFFSK